MKITYDAKSFQIDGRRIWLAAAEIHYFRHPVPEWRQVLLRAKRAGLNAVATYVPWNFHELTEGEADFGSDKDLAGYIDLIGELGMYAMVRPGPYICSEWDGGGIPAWLSAKPVLRFREDDPVYMAAVESWFDRLLPLIGERQMTRGGPVLTVQNENEYPGGWDASMRRYIAKINAMFRKHDIDVPILACNVHGDSATKVRINDAVDPDDQMINENTILTYNHHVVVEPVYDLKAKQPNAPLITTEFWCGAPIYWGNQVTDWPEPLSLARAAYEYASSGTQICYYMFEGGTNFGFWSGNNIATSYASGYPVGEGGMLTPKYYAARPVNLFAGQFAAELAASEERADKAGIVVPDGVRLVVREAPQGAMAFLSVKDNRKEIPVALPGGRSLTVHLGEVSAAVIPVGLEVFAGVTVDYSSLTLLARDESRKTLVLFGPAGTEGVLGVNGEQLRIPVGRRQIACRETAGITILVADEEMARRCWIADGHLLFGPDYVGETKDDGSLDIRVSDASPETVYVGKDGKPALQSFVPVADDAVAPVLSAWRMASCASMLTDAKTTGWQPLEEPRSHEDLGVFQGYVWYSAELECEQDGVETLLLTHAPSRISVFANGRYCGAHAERRNVRMRDEYGHPADWAFEELTVPVVRGRNRFVFLSDDLGHNYDVPMPVGIRGPVYAGSRIAAVDRFREMAPQPVSEDAFRFLYSRFYRQPEPLPAVEFELAVEPGRDAFILMHGVHAWVTVDGEEVQPLSYPESPWTMFAQIKRWLTWQLPKRVSGSTVTVRIQYSESAAQLVQENMTVYTVPKSGRLSNWQWQRWTETGDFDAAQAVVNRESEQQGEVVLLPVGGRLNRKGKSLAPAYFETTFTVPQGDRPVYLDIGQLFKGQIILNGRNVGRFWRLGGTQQRYYLPRAWMQADNRLVLFEELGLYPQDVSLVWGEAGQWAEISWNPED